MSDCTDVHGPEDQADRWSDLAAEWSRLWGHLALPVWDRLVEVTGATVGTRVLDVGCGAGELLAHLAGSGAVLAGTDPAPEMLALARQRVPHADLRDAISERLPWPDASMDLVVTVNALQFADDPVDAVAEAVRVTAPGGWVAVAIWAEDALNDLTVVEHAVARDAGEEPADGGPLRQPGGLAAVLREAGITPDVDETVSVGWTAPDDATLARSVLLGEDDDVIATRGRVVVDAAAPFRQSDGSYRLANTFRLAAGRSQGRGTAVGLG